jgi:hypothetical protein
MMTSAFVVALSVAVLYFAKRWRDTSAENDTLRNQVASLKRQLRRANRTG